MSAPAISVVVPTFNGAASLPALLNSLWSQRTAHPLEIIAVDSGSTDGTIELLAGRVQTIVQVAPADFDHGLSRNAGIERATGEFVVLLVQDAEPVGTDWIDRLVAPLIANETLAGTFSRQVPRADASALARAQLRDYPGALTDAWTSRLTGGRREFDALSPVERMRRCTFDNVASCLRRSVWVRHPFKATPIAEDVEWAREVLLAGFGISFVPDAVVIHSHDRSARYEFERTRLLHERLFRLFGLRTIPRRSDLARAMVSSLGVHLGREWRSPAQWPRAAALAVAWPYGQYLGGRLGQSGVTSPRRPGVA